MKKTQTLRTALFGMGGEIKQGGAENCDFVVL